MNIVTGTVSAAMITLALVSPPASGTGDCSTAGDAFQATLAKVVNALRSTLPMTTRISVCGPVRSPVTGITVPN